MITWWRGEENLNDELGRAPLQGNTLYGEGVIGNGFRYADGLEATISATSTFSLEGWVRPGWESAINVDGDWSGTIASWGWDGTEGFWLGATTDTSRCPAPYCTAPLLTLWLGPSVVAYAWRFDAMKLFDHVALTCGEGVATLYLNGHLEAMTTAPAAAVPASHLFSVGDAPKKPVGVQGQWDGVIDELSLYNVALTQPQIAAIVAAGRYGKCR
jgi:hypothetical protein